MSLVRRLYSGETDVDFQRWWKWGVRLSASLLLVSIASLAFRGLNLGIDFEGGLLWEVKAPGVTVEKAREALRAVGEGEAKIQIVGSDTLRVQSGAEAGAKQEEVRKVVADLGGGVPVSDVAVSNVGPSWGGEVTASAVRALVVFFIGVLIFLTLTLEFKMAVGAIIAVVHDVVISVGVYSVFQFEVTPATVIAFLTILGFSIYDTVVVFDKVKENEGRVGLASRVTYSEMMSLSMNQVLVRSLNTTIVALIPVLSLLVVGAGLMGAVTLEEFALALTVGLTVGSYSSIFIAAPTLVWMKEREPRNRQLRSRLEAQRAAAERAAADADATDLVPAGAPKGTDTGKGKSMPSPAAGRATGGDGAVVAPRPRKKQPKKR